MCNPGRETAASRPIEAAGFGRGGDAGGVRFGDARLGRASASRYPRAAATEAESGVVGRPISFESVWLSSNSAPFEASTPQPAIALAIPSGRPCPASAPAYSSTERFL